MVRFRVIVIVRVRVFVSLFFILLISCFLTFFHCILFGLLFLRFAAIVVVSTLRPAHPSRGLPLSTAVMP